MKKNPLEILQTIAQTIYDKKGFNILVLDLQEISTVTDYVVIAEGNVDRHLQSIASAIIEELEKHNHKSFHTEGFDSGDWVVIDYLDMMIHLFLPKIREKYQLERLWKQGKIVDLDIKIDKTKDSVSYSNC
jgi:ribosome-associated protein